MARYFHVHMPQARPRIDHSVRPAALLLILLLAALTAMVWASGPPVASLLPIAPPA